MANRKRMTQREKALRAQVKKRLQEKGVLPPNKPRLNRKKFAEEAWGEWVSLLGEDYIRAEAALLHAIGFLVGPELLAVTPEQVGILKLLKVAAAYDRFRKKLETEGRTEYTLEELADEVVLPVWRL